MSKPIATLAAMLQSLDPQLNSGVFVFATAHAEFNLEALNAIATFRESEGLTLVVEEGEAERAGLRAEFRAAWITLRINSDLHAVGLTAAVSAALAQAGISCNVLAAVHHDHIFVPVEAAAAALAALRALQSQSQASAPVLSE